MFSLAFFDVDLLSYRLFPVRYVFAGGVGLIVVSAFAVMLMAARQKGWVLYGLVGIAAAVVGFGPTLSGLARAWQDQAAWSEHSYWTPGVLAGAETVIVINPMSGPSCYLCIDVLAHGDVSEVYRLEGLGLSWQSGRTLDDILADPSVSAQVVYFAEGYLPNRSSPQGLIFRGIDPTDVPRPDVTIVQHFAYGGRLHIEGLDEIPQGDGALDAVEVYASWPSLAARPESMIVGGSTRVPWPVIWPIAYTRVWNEAGSFAERLMADGA